jgi:hypothetical protein
MAMIVVASMMKMKQGEEAEEAEGLVVRQEWGVVKAQTNAKAQVTTRAEAKASPSRECDTCETFMVGNC